jgi:hypothetical protein
VIDRALDYAALAAQGLTPAAIARRRRRSKGYVSIVLRLGAAIRTLEPLELEVLRSPRVTWKVAQRIVRADADVATVRRKLRDAVAWPPDDRRKHRKGRSPARGAPSSPPTAPGAFAWSWDSTGASTDPAAVLDAYLAYLTSLHRDVSTRLRQTIGARAPTPPIPSFAGQSLRSLTRSVARMGTGAAESSAGVTPEDRATLATLAELDRIMATLRA